MPFFGKRAPRGAIPGWMHIPPRAPPASGAAHKSPRASSASPSRALGHLAVPVSPGSHRLSCPCPRCAPVLIIAGLLRSHLDSSLGCRGEARRCSAQGRGSIAGCREQRPFPRQKAVWKRLFSRSEVLCCFALCPCVCSPLYRAARGKPRVFGRLLEAAPGCSCLLYPPSSIPLFIQQAGWMLTAGHGAIKAELSLALSSSPNPWERMLGCWTPA